LGALPVISAVSGWWAWNAGDFADQPGLWVGRPGKTAVQVMDRAMSNLLWAPDGRSLVFKDTDDHLYLATEPDFIAEPIDTPGLADVSIMLVWP
jgi:hypothetical protein